MIAILTARVNSLEMAECATSSSESFGTPLSTPSDDATTVQDEQCAKPKQSRSNTVGEKRAMRREQKKRLVRKLEGVN